ncbi:dUTPase [Turkeypox virus]|uniref:Deoxyuridine 5'-triphosphate nucleotidohydrolase n=1 Tax=Turkeypox virus TaxID=336486 RepID=A0A0M3ZCL9_9POXV|nr:dUTPase [Turkeypox virus]ALA62392.1 dUTPase [Turkeypox virus]
MGKQLVMTDIIIDIPEGLYGRISPRSGLACNHFIDVGAGVIDRDYRGNIGILLFNFSKDVFYVNKGDRVAQLIFEKIAHPEIREVKTVEELSITERGGSGFGSGGLR